MTLDSTSLTSPVLNTFQDVINAVKGKNVAVVATRGHAHRLEGATVGRFTDVNNTLSGTWGFRKEGAYLNPTNARVVAQSWNDNIQFMPKALIIMQFCNLGNWTKMDIEGTGVSVVQTTADTTGCFVVSPGGFYKGQFAVTSDTQRIRPIGTAVFYNDPDSRRTYDYYGDPPGAQTDQQKSYYNSMQDTYYLSFPRKQKK